MSYLPRVVERADGSSTEHTLPDRTRSCQPAVRCAGGGEVQSYAYNLYMLTRCPSCTMQMMKCANDEMRHPACVNVEVIRGNHSNAATLESMTISAECKTSCPSQCMTSTPCHDLMLSYRSTPHLVSLLNRRLLLLRRHLLVNSLDGRVLVLGSDLDGALGFGPAPSVSEVRSGAERSEIWA